MSGWRTFWNDEHGAVASTEMIILGTVVILGTIAGLASFRDSLVQELGDVSAATAVLSQSYRFNEINQNGVVDSMSYEINLPETVYSDMPDFGVPANPDPSGAEPMGIVISEDLIGDEQ